jgi:uncharacterized protein (DUF1330 family)
MAAYVISEVELLDETQGRRYRELAAASIARHGGRYLARGAAPVVAEGDWPAARRLVLVEFPTMERLQTWYESADYAEALAVRQTALDRRLLFVDGAHTAPGLGWPDTGEGQPRQPAKSSSPARSSPASG